MHVSRSGYARASPVTRHASRLRSVALRHVTSRRDVQVVCVVVIGGRCDNNDDGGGDEDINRRDPLSRRARGSPESTLGIHTALNKIPPNDVAGFVVPTRSWRTPLSLSLSVRLVSIVPAGVNPDRRARVDDVTNDGRISLFVI